MSINLREGRRVTSCRQTDTFLPPFWLTWNSRCGTTGVYGDVVERKSSVADPFAWCPRKRTDVRHCLETNSTTTRLVNQVKSVDNRMEWINSQTWTHWVSVGDGTGQQRKHLISESLSGPTWTTYRRWLLDSSPLSTVPSCDDGRDGVWGRRVPWREGKGRRREVLGREERNGEIVGPTTVERSFSFSFSFGRRTVSVTICRSTPLRFTKLSNQDRLNFMFVWTKCSVLTEVALG